MDINKIKIIAASIGSDNLDEFSANLVLNSIKHNLLEAVGGNLQLIQARVLCDAGDYFQYLELDLPPGTEPIRAHEVLMGRYYESGEYGPDSYIMSVRGITQDGEFWEVPFVGDLPLTKINRWLGVKVQSGALVSGPNEVWDAISLIRIRKANF